MRDLNSRLEGRNACAGCLRSRSTAATARGGGGQYAVARFPARAVRPDRHQDRLRRRRMRRLHGADRRQADAVLPDAGGDRRGQARRHHRVARAPTGNLSAVQRGFHEKLGSQCGYCTPGFIMASAGLLRKNPNPSDDEILQALGSNICRCTGYVKIIEAVKYAAALDAQGWRREAWNASSAASSPRRRGPIHRALSQTAPRELGPGSPPISRGRPGRQR